MPWNNQRQLSYSFVFVFFASLITTACDQGVSTLNNSEVAPELPATLNLPAGGQSIIASSPLTDFILDRGENNGPVGSVQKVNVSHANFESALQINVDKPNGQFYNGRVSLPIIQPLTVGDVVLLHLHFRMLETTDETGTGFITAFVESPAPKYTKYLSHRLVSTGEWQEYYLPMTIGKTFNPNEIMLNFGFGGGSKSQVIQLANIQLLNYKNNLSFDDLPVTKPSYQGREENAAWRAEAAKRIEKHRKSNFSVVIKDKSGAPVSDAAIKVEFVKHAYHFGTVAAARHLVSEEKDSQIYRQKLLANFNQSGLENNLKWDPWIGGSGEMFSQTKALGALQWLRAQDLYTRGHVMVWPSKRNTADFVQKYLPENNPQDADPKVLEELKLHISDLSAKTKGLIDEWDVLNEPFDNHYLMDAFGEQVMIDWFLQAAQENPGIPLYINDYSIISAGGINAVHQDHYFNVIDYLVTQRAPISGIGIQSHFSATPTSITRVYDILQRYASAFPGLAIRSTEFDIDSTDEALQADYTRDFLTIFFSHPATVGVQKWGFWAGAHWRPNAAMYTQDWQAKPNQQAWQQTVFETFWNDFSGKTDAQGTFSERGFYGTYKLIIETNGKPQSFPMVLQPNGKTVFTFQMK